MLKRLVVATAAVGAAALMIPTSVALAHDHTISATCEQLSVELFNYSADAANTNTVDIWVDGSAAVSTTFGSSFSWSHAFSDATIDHTYRVAVTSTMFPEGTFDTGVQTIECAESTTTTTATPTTTTTTTAPSTTTTTTAPLIVPPTTAVASGAGVAAPTPPASVVAQPVAPAAPPTPAVASAGAVAADDSLPATGADEGRIALIALAGVVLGATMIGIARRRHADRPS